MGLPASAVKVGEIMSEKLETIKVVNTAQEAAKKMASKHVGSLAVMHEDGTAAGIVTERDLVRQLCATDRQASKVAVGDILSSPVKSLRADASIGEAADYMVRNRIRHLLVVGEDNRPKGILSSTDLVSYVRENTGSVMEADRDVIKALESEGRYYF